MPVTPQIWVENTFSVVSTPDAKGARIFWVSLNARRLRLS